MVNKVGLMDLHINLCKSDGVVKILSDIKTSQDMIAFLKKEGKNIFNFIATNIFNNVSVAISELRYRFCIKNEIFDYDEYIELKKKALHTLTEHNIDTSNIEPDRNDFLNLIMHADTELSVITEIEHKRTLSLDSGNTDFMDCEVKIFKNLKNKKFGLKLYEKLVRSFKYAKFDIIEDVLMSTDSFNKLFEWDRFVKHVVGDLQKDLCEADVLDTLYEYIVCLVGHVVNYFNGEKHYVTKFNDFTIVNLADRICERFYMNFDASHKVEFNTNNNIDISVSIY